MVNAISLFSGAGGFCEGTRLAGWKVLCSVEADDHACLTYAANFPGVPLFRGDIGRFLVEKQTGVPEVEQLLVKGVDVVYGGPPSAMISYFRVGPGTASIKCGPGASQPGASQPRHRVGL